MFLLHFSFFALIGIDRGELVSVWGKHKAVSVWSFMRSSLGDRVKRCTPSVCPSVRPSRASNFLEIGKKPLKLLI